MSFLDHFWGRTRREGECLMWTGPIAKSTGYGVVGGGRLAHRLAWELANATEVPRGLLVCHRCDVKPCVEPTHLFIGTTRDNSYDMLRKERGRGNAHLLQIDGETEPAAVWATRYGIPRHTLLARLRKGWPAELAVKTPVLRLANLIRSAGADVEGIEKRAYAQEEP